MEHLLATICIFWHISFLVYLGACTVLCGKVTSTKQGFVLVSHVVCACVRACVRACVPACVRVCVRASVRACVCVHAVVCVVYSANMTCLGVVGARCYVGLVRFYG